MPDWSTALAGRRLAQHSLGLSGHTAVNLGLAVALPSGAALDALGLPQPGPALAMPVILLAAVQLFARVSRARGRAWLERLPFEVDAPGYVAALDTRALKGVVTVRVTLAEALAPVEPPAVDPALGTLEAGPGTLTLTSPVIPTAAFGLYAVPHNGPVHRWFHRVCDTVLSPLHERAPIARVEVTRAPA